MLVATKKWTNIALGGVAPLIASTGYARAADNAMLTDPNILVIVALTCLSALLAWRLFRSQVKYRSRQIEDGKYRVMVDRMLDGLYITEEGRLIFVNPALAQLLGFNAADLIGRHYQDFISPNSTQLVDEIRHRRHAGDNVPKSYEIRLLHKDGVTEIPVILNPELVSLEEGRVVSIGTITNITERVRVEEALRASERQLSEAQKIGRIGHWRIDIKTHEVECSDVYYEIFGWDRNRITPTLGRIIASIHPEDRERTNAQRVTAVADRKPYKFTCRVLRPDGEVRIIRDEGQPEYDEKGQILSIFGVSQDITEQKQIEDELLRERRRAEDANNAKSEFLAAISHEIRTPLNAILGFSEIMDDKMFGALGNQKYAEYVGDIRSSAAHLLDLVGDILDISAIEAGEFSLSQTDLDLDTVLEECLKVVRVQARNAGVELIANISEDLPTLHADRRAVKQVVINLLTNAIKFTPEGGRINIALTTANSALLVTVADTGIGIPEDVLPDIILPFDRGKQDPHESKEGTGLGLAIVNSLVALHGGNIEIESVVGAGTTVRVQFPLINRAAA